MQSELLKIEFEWGSKPTPEQVEKIILTGNPCKLEDDGSMNWSSRDCSMTLDEALDIGLEFKVKQRLGVQRLIEDFGISNAPAPVNERCHVIVSGSHLMSIREVKAMENLCTDILQSELNAGWCILAICVQPDTRRPDYILGRRII